MSTCVPVVGVGCSGTSMVAGMVDAMGCPMMGNHHKRMTKHKTKGFDLYEDPCFYETDWSKDDMLRLYYKHKRTGLWGWKNTLTINHLPRMIRVMREKEPQLKVKVVAVNRKLSSVIKGRMEGGCPPGVKYNRRDAEKWAIRAQATMWAGLDAILSWGMGDVHLVEYEDVLEKPWKEGGKLMYFMTGDIRESAVAAAVGRIRVK